MALKLFAPDNPLCVRAAGLADFFRLLMLAAPILSSPFAEKAWESFDSMARPERFELPTAWFVARYSIQLSYGRVIIVSWRRERDSNPRWSF